jgi:hypothetical protein
MEKRRIGYIERLQNAFYLKQFSWHQGQHGSYGLVKIANAALTNLSTM